MTRVGHADAEFLKHPHAARADQVAARLVPGEGRLVDQGDAGAGPGEHQSSDTAARAGPHHDRVPARRVHAAGLTVPSSWGPLFWGPFS